MGKGSAPWFGDVHPGPGPAAVIPLDHLDEPGFLQHGQVPGQVPGRQAERVPQIAEFGPRLGRDGQDAQPVPLVHGVIQATGRVRLDLPPRL